MFKNKSVKAIKIHDWQITKSHVRSIYKWISLILQNIDPLISYRRFKNLDLGPISL